jgi:hypothetical protein
VKYFKFTKSWVVKVEDEVQEEDAKKLIDADPEKYLDSETTASTRTEYKNRPQSGGWVNGFKDQLFATNGKR